MQPRAGVGRYINAFGAAPSQVSPTVPTNMTTSSLAPPAGNSFLPGVRGTTPPVFTPTAPMMNGGSGSSVVAPQQQHYAPVMNGFNNSTAAVHVPPTFGEQQQQYHHQQQQQQSSMYGGEMMTEVEL